MSKMEIKDDAGWTACVMRCINKFILDYDHNDGKSPLVYGPCRECMKEHWDEFEVGK